MTFEFDGELIEFTAGMTLASALLLAGKKSLRTTQTRGVARGVYCMMGSCFDCLVNVDGVPNQQACQVLAHQNAKVKSQCSCDAPFEESL